MLTALREMGGRQVDESDLRVSISAHNKQRGLMGDVQAWHNSMTYTLRWALSLAGMLMPVDEHIKLLRTVLAAGPSKAPVEPAGIRVVLAGTVMDDQNLPNLLDELGFEVVGDDLCTGERFYRGQVDEIKAPLEALTEYYGTPTRCLGRHDPEAARVERLLQTIRSNRADGAIIIEPKYCDPCAFESVQIRQALRAAQVPFLVLQTDSEGTGAQHRTRLQAFSEMM
jgi:benzoyl-CoA reductase/2-hydroxyglutaryl-CoA dehydratase subunit BcrC/BadD/HgdB